jgi:hypothetical protein
MKNWKIGGEALKRNLKVQSWIVEMEVENWKLKTSTDKIDKIQSWRLQLIQLIKLNSSFKFDTTVLIAPALDTSIWLNIQLPNNKWS